MIIINTDGGARGNPGKAGIGVAAKRDGSPLFTLKRYLGDGITNNWAEYEAVIAALTEAKAQGLSGETLEVRMDSQLVVEQISGNWKIKEPNLKVQAEKAHALLADFPGSRFIYVPREENGEADRLVNEAIDEAVLS